MIRKLDHTDNVNEVLHGVFKRLESIISAEYRNSILSGA